mmetsp:Transcript_1925/g.3909  ORF Transcript_1925/g.3909 Transcript_1925/m.3909 type:complete len:170 (-) Transcript_1925:221-730(-)|eukprot:CAMPEP_0174698378 /NCGR_PEP_ID=MMETSP1094-20130205/3994_1 /TAXON_ID=156173 /ORGANISM="Chrysochromulina brevifilum, Strain UTEX LB 985" /LENGTH=169 /DNA_ID=CAMNT_0015895547 /DNA_START=243 /DNA_END=752 /DNA_ORIENTATION=-
MPQFSASVPYRGREACREEAVDLEDLPTVKKQRGGTVGKGSRQGTHRSLLEQAAYEWDADGWQLASLGASLLIFLDDASRRRICSSDGRHQCGLVLVRPRRTDCSATECLCKADTVAMAARIGADKRQVIGWWSGQLTAARQDATQLTPHTSAGDEHEPRSPSARQTAG